MEVDYSKKIPIKRPVEKKAVSSRLKTPEREPCDGHVKNAKKTLFGPTLFRIVKISEVSLYKLI